MTTPTDHDLACSFCGSSVYFNATSGEVFCQDEKSTDACRATWDRNGRLVTSDSGEAVRRAHATHQ